jgi:hypothetical protein
MLQQSNALSTLQSFLFDLDGVLVTGEAYHEAIVRTLELLLRRLLAADPQKFLPTKKEIFYFEAQGIHDVWDITNIVYALIYVSVFLGENQLTVDRPNFCHFVDKVARRAGAHQPLDASLSLLRDELEARFDGTELGAKMEELTEILLGSRSVYRSIGTRIFQNLILGSRSFEDIYRIPCEFASESLLLAKETVLINQDTVRTILSLRGTGKLQAGIFTARPSEAPPSCQAAGYSPEAELAAKLCGLSELPVIGMGTMQWLAGSHNERSEDLVKPEVTHAMAALLCTVIGSVTAEHLEQSYRIARLDESADRTMLAQVKDCPLTVSIFEDTVSGIKSALAAAQRLQRQGYCLTVQALGIATDEAKHAALAQVCHKVFPDVNEAIRYALLDCSELGIDSRRHVS